jgi:hypothetical protein
VGAVVARPDDDRLVRLAVAVTIGERDQPVGPALSDEQRPVRRHGHETRPGQPGRKGSHGVVRGHGRPTDSTHARVHADASQAQHLAAEDPQQAGHDDQRDDRRGPLMTRRISRA